MAAPGAAIDGGHFVVHPYRPQFLQSPGRPPVEWSRWLMMFEDWLHAIGCPTTDAFASRKAALLRASLGPEGARIYYSLAATAGETYATVVDRMARHFGRPASTIFNRAQFTRYQQRPGESIVEFLSTLRELARKCDFKEDQFDERVRDQFAAGCTNDRIRERLLQEAGTALLEDLERLAVTMERALQEAPALASSAYSSNPSVNHIGGNRRSSASSNSAQRCANCGRSGHTASAESCVARGKTCDRCGKTGHFASVCRSASNSKQANVTSSYGRESSRASTPHRLNRSQSRSRRSAQTHNIDSDESDDCDDDIINSVSISAVHTTKAGEFKQVRCSIQNVNTELMLDLGAKVSILSSDFYQINLVSTVPLRKSSIVLRTYSGEPIPCMGRVFVTVQLGSKLLTQFPFHITERGSSMMGVDLFDALGGSVQVGDAEIVSTSPVCQSISAVVTDRSSICLDDYPVLLKTSGTLKGFVHRPMINHSVAPVQQKFWHLPLALRDPVSKELHRLEADGVIERIDASPWTSNIVTAKKRDGSLRLCVNLTEVNKALIPERYPLPTMAELTEHLSGSMMYSKIDLLWGYLQLPLAEDRRYLTGFVTHEGVWQFRSLPFGLASGPSAFQQVIKKILHGLEGCTNILDDILVYGRNVAEHDERLRRVLDRLVEYNATVRRDKCVVGAAAVDFNGHHISASGVRPLLSNVEAIQNIPVPTDQKQLLRFVGMASYYLKFISGFAELCEPLRRLMKADAVWNWSPECQRCFTELKRRLTCPPVLAHFDTLASTVVTCDSSSVALGACLSQQHHDGERPIAFASRTLSPAERKYSASEREALACLWACEHWNYYLYGRVFKLVTDHQSLKTLLTTGGSGHRPLRLHRWSDRLFQYSFTVSYRPGRLNVVADCLSRASADVPEVGISTSADNEEDPEVGEIQTIFGHVATSVMTLTSVAAATAADPDLQTVMNYINTGWPSQKSEMASEIRVYYNLRIELSVVGQCLLRGSRVVIPSTLRQSLLELAHEGHPGVSRMKSKCRESIWWPGIDADVERAVRDCQACIISGKSVRPSPGPLHPVPRPAGPWRKLSLDIAGEFHVAPRSHRFMLVLVDYYSKWPEAATCEYVTSASVISFLTQIFDRFGLVEEIVTDNGPQLVSAEFEAFLSSLGIRHSRSALYNPQAQAEVERFNRVMKDGLKTGLADGKDFQTAIRQTLATYRTTPHCTTGVTPASLMLAFPVRTPLTLLQQSANRLMTSSSSIPSHPVKSSSKSKSSPDPSTVIAARVRFKQQLSADYHDRKFRAKLSSVKAGDLVRIKLPTRSHKLAPTYSEPRRVSKANETTVWLENGQRWSLRRCLLHRSSLRATEQSTAPMTSSSDAASSIDDSDPAADADESQGPVFTFRLPTSPQAQGQVQEPRRSARVRKQRDFGPVVSH
jgi:hypothetical protein